MYRNALSITPMGAPTLAGLRLEKQDPFYSASYFGSITLELLLLQRHPITRCWHHDTARSPSSALSPAADGGQEEDRSLACTARA